MTDPISITHSNFHIVANAAYQEALEENGLNLDEFRDQTKSYARKLSMVKQDFQFDTNPQKRNFLKELMGIFPSLLQQLNSFLKDQRIIKMSLTKKFDLFSGLLSQGAEAVYYKFGENFISIEDTYHSRLLTIEELEKSSGRSEQLEAAKELLTREIKIINSFKQSYCTFAAGLINAIKTYFGFAKLAHEKLSEAGSFTSEQLKSLIKNNRSLIIKVSSLPMALLLLFDKLNGVLINKEGPYKFNSNNFEISRELVLPKQDFLEDFLAKAKDVKNTGSSAKGVD